MSRIFHLIYCKLSQALVWSLPRYVMELIHYSLLEPTMVKSQLMKDICCILILFLRLYNRLDYDMEHNRE